LPFTHKERSRGLGLEEKNCTKPGTLAAEFEALFAYIVGDVRLT
jgi:hypothetical protein